MSDRLGLKENLPFVPKHLQLREDVEPEGSSWERLKLHPCPYIDQPIQHKCYRMASATEETQGIKGHQYYLL